MLKLLPLLLAVVLYAALLKLAAKVYRKSVLAWGYAFGLAALTFVVAVAGALLNRGLASAAMALAGVAIQFVLSGWYLGRYARGIDGEPIRLKGGMLVFAIAFCIVIALGLLMTLLLPPLLPQGGGPA